jgi:heat shock protein HtpX
MGYSNIFKTVLLLVLLSALFLGVGYMIGGRGGMATAFMLSLIMNFCAYWFSDKIILAMHSAKPIKQEDSLGVYEIVKNLCIAAKLPMPKVYLIPGQIPNAFATGRNPQNAAVAVTEGIAQILNKNELRGVIAHELSHIRNRDILIATIAASIASAIMYLAHMLQWAGMMGGHRGDRDSRGVNPLAMLVTIILAPLAATLIQAAVSRSREYMADDSGARIAGDPESLALALEKISSPRITRGFQGEGALLGTQSAFVHMYIVNNLRGESVMNLFSTHPPVKERVKRLRAIKKV